MEQQVTSYYTQSPVVSVDNPNDINSHPGKYTWTVSVLPPRYSATEYIMDSYDILSFADIGYTVTDKLWTYSTSRYPNYQVVRFIDAPRPPVYVATGATGEGEWTYPATNQVYKMVYANNSLFGIKLGYDNSIHNHPILRSGEHYLIVLKADIFNENGAVLDAWRLQSGDFDIVKQGTGNTFTVWWEIVPRRDLYTNEIYALATFPKSQTTTMNLYSFSATNIINFDSVEEAIRDQTNDMNKNHDETMDKIDDVTDFDDQEQSDLTGAVDGASDQINDKLGILSFGDHVLDQFIGIFDAAAGSPGLTLPGFSIEVDGVQHVVWTDQVFDLSTIEDKFGPLMTAVHFATSFLVYAALVMYVQKIFGAIMQDWSDK